MTLISSTCLYHLTQLLEDPPLGPHARYTLFTKLSIASVTVLLELLDKKYVEHQTTTVDQLCKYTPLIW